MSSTDQGIPVLLSVIVGACLVACGSDEARPSVLFAGSDTRLAPEEMSAIEAAFAERFSLSGDGLHFVDENCGEIPTRTEIVDLNGDGVAESCEAPDCPTAYEFIDSDGDGVKDICQPIATPTPTPTPTATPLPTPTAAPTPGA